MTKLATGYYNGKHKPVTGLIMAKKQNLLTVTYDLNTDIKSAYKICKNCKYFSHSEYFEDYDSYKTLIEDKECTKYPQIAYQTCIVDCSDFTTRNP